MPSVLLSTLVAWSDAARLFSQNKHEQSREALQRISHPSAKIMFSFAITSIQLGQLQRAIEELTHAVELDSYFAVAYYIRALCHVDSNNMQDAYDDLATALESMRGNAVVDYRQLGLKQRLYACEIHYNMAWCAEALGLRGAMESHLREAGNSSLHQTAAHKAFLTLTHPRLPLVRVEKWHIFSPPAQKTNNFGKVKKLPKSEVKAAKCPEDFLSAGFNGPAEWKKLKKRLRREHRERKNCPSMLDVLSIIQEKFPAVPLDELVHRPPTHEVTADFNPTRSGTIPLREGDRLIVIINHGNGWADGVNMRTGVAGEFPLACAKPIFTQAEMASPAPKEHSQQQQQLPQQQLPASPTSPTKPVPAPRRPSFASQPAGVGLGAPSGNDDVSAPAPKVALLPPTPQPRPRAVTFKSEDSNARTPAVAAPAPSKSALKLPPPPMPPPSELGLDNARRGPTAPAPTTLSTNNALLQRSDSATSSSPVPAPGLAPEDEALYENLAPPPCPPAIPPFPPAKASHSSPILTAAAATSSSSAPSSPLQTRRGATGSPAMVAAPAPSSPPTPPTKPRGLALGSSNAVAPAPWPTTPPPPPPPPFRERLGSASVATKGAVPPVVAAPPQPVPPALAPAPRNPTAPGSPLATTRRALQPPTTPAMVPVTTPLVMPPPPPLPAQHARPTLITVAPATNSADAAGPSLPAPPTAAPPPLPVKAPALPAAKSARTVPPQPNYPAPKRSNANPGSGPASPAPTPSSPAPASPAPAPASPSMFAPTITSRAVPNLPKGAVDIFGAARSAPATQPTPVPRSVQRSGSPPLPAPNCRFGPAATGSSPPPSPRTSGSPGPSAVVRPVPARARGCSVDEDGPVPAPRMPMRLVK